MTILAVEVDVVLYMAHSRRQPSDWQLIKTCQNMMGPSHIQLSTPYPAKKRGVENRWAFTASLREYGFPCINFSWSKVVCSCLLAGEIMTSHQSPEERADCLAHTRLEIVMRLPYLVAAARARSCKSVSGGDVSGASTSAHALAERSGGSAAIGKLGSPAPHLLLKSTQAEVKPA